MNTRLCLLYLVAASSMFAATVHVDFSGTIIGMVDTYGYFAAPGTTYAAGTAFSLSIAYDPTLCSGSSSSTSESRSFCSAGSASSLTIGGATVSDTFDPPNSANGFGFSQFVGGGTPATPVNFEWRYGGPNYQIIALLRSTGYVPGSVDAGLIAQVVSAEMFVCLANNTHCDQTDTQSLTLAATPEPSSVVLGGGGVLAFFVRRRRHLFRSRNSAAPTFTAL